MSNKLFWTAARTSVLTVVFGVILTTSLAQEISPYLRQVDDSEPPAPLPFGTKVNPPANLAGKTVNENTNVSIGASPAGDKGNQNKAGNILHLMPVPEPIGRDLLIIGGVTIAIITYRGRVKRR